MVAEIIPLSSLHIERAINKLDPALSRYLDPDDMLRFYDKITKIAEDEVRRLLENTKGPLIKDDVRSKTLFVELVASLLVRAAARHIARDRYEKSPKPPP